MHLLSPPIMYLALHQHFASQTLYVTCQITEATQKGRTYIVFASMLSFISISQKSCEAAVWHIRDSLAQMALLS